MEITHINLCQSVYYVKYTRIYVLRSLCACKQPPRTRAATRRAFRLKVKGLCARAAHSNMWKYIMYAASPLWKARAFSYAVRACGGHL